MNIKLDRLMNHRSLRSALVVAFVAAAALVAVHPGTTNAAAQKSFETADAAFQALADAAKTYDSKTLAALLGPSGTSVVNSGDAVADKANAARFAADYAEKHNVVTEGTKATLVVGKDDWPLPIPAVKGANGWTLDAKAGAREILARRIGQNELEAIQVVRAVVDAQHDYSDQDHDANGLRDYAAKFISTKGKKDGLYWPTKEGEASSPLGPLIGEATAEGYKSGAAPYHGYYYRMLTAQGKDAPGGVRNYMVHGHLLGGFAVVAYPATYGNSGIMTFIVNQDGTVYQKDLGEKTAAAAKAIKAYNPDKSWTAVK
ncbi:MAG TPA: DUF2950 domain-containing protein [Casimicrobiaceae bacterium]|nr:DUF2950 domain-containing protein [Casimicrobiaceae bacterium]